MIRAGGAYSYLSSSVETIATPFGSFSSGACALMFVNFATVTGTHAGFTISASVSGTLVTKPDLIYQKNLVSYTASTALFLFKNLPEIPSSKPIRFTVHFASEVVGDTHIELFRGVRSPRILTEFERGGINDNKTKPPTLYESNPNRMAITNIVAKTDGTYAVVSAIDDYDSAYESAPQAADGPFALYTSSWWTFDKYGQAVNLIDITASEWLATKLVVLGDGEMLADNTSGSLMHEVADAREAHLERVTRDFEMPESERQRIATEHQEYAQQAEKLLEQEIQTTRDQMAHFELPDEKERLASLEGFMQRAAVEREENERNVAEEEQRQLAEFERAAAEARSEETRLLAELEADRQRKIVEARETARRRAATVTPLPTLLAILRRR